METQARTRLLIISPSPAVESGPDAGRETGKTGGGSESGSRGFGNVVRPRRFRTAWELCGSLCGPYDVILAVPEKTLLSHPDFAVVYYNRRNIGLLANDSEAVICDEEVVKSYPFLVEEVSPLVTTPGKLMAAGPESLLDDPARARKRDAGARESGSGEDSMYVWRPPAAEHDKGIRYYVKRLRLHFRRGGVRGAAAKGGSLIKRRFS